MRRLAALLALTATACSDAGVTKFNTPPTAEISSHADGDTVREGFAETLRGTVGDANHTFDQLSVVWLVDGTDVCPESTPDDAGLVTCDHTFLPTGGEVVLEVRDPEGGSGSARVTVDVQPTDAPLAEIIAPTSDGVYYAEQLITFQGTVSDAEDAAEDLTVTWETDALGDLGLTIDVTSEGAVEAFGELEEGEHAVRLRVVDTTGKEGVDSVVIDVGPPNSSPGCEITAPEDGSSGSEGEEVRFTATVSDPDVPADWLTVTWTSDIDDLLRESTPSSSGDVAFAYSDLSVGTHTITLTATDEIGATCSDFIFYSVGTPPELTVTAPVDGDVFNETDPVDFAATAIDGEDLETDIVLAWTSDVDGEFSDAGADSDGDIAFSAELTPGPHTITARATDTDGLFDQTTFDIIINQVPTQPTVTITPDPAYTDNTLTAVATGSTDPDGSGAVTYSYAWYEDGILSSVSTTATFPGSDTQKNSTYRVIVTPSDGTGAGPTGEAERTIDNSEPVLTGPTLSASTVVVGDTLTCSASATDADGDTVSITYAWTDGTVGPTYTVTDANDPGDVITCTATADDGDGGVVTGTASATVDNTDPVIDSIEVDPSTGRVGDTLTCTATASDDDGGTPTITYAWSSGDTGPTYTIAASDDPGDTITCTATATDTDGGSASDTASATVENTDPTVDSVTVTPSTAAVGDDLTCAATASDADGGSPTITYAWSTGETGDTYTIVASDDPGDVITCTATATDTDGGSASDTASATVTNSDPTVDSISVTPSTGPVGTELTCAATASDDDGGSPTITYVWSSGDTGDTYTIAASDDPGDVITCTATAADTDGGSSSDTASATVTNTDPVIDSISVSPSTGPVGTELTCAATASDDDGGTPTITYAWSSGDTGDTYTIAASDDPGDVITCTATASDTDGGSGSDTASATVENTDPTVDSVTVTPSSGQVGDTLTCAATASDTDGGAPTITYTWPDASTGPTYTIQASDDPGDTITCTATATDADLGTGTGTASATVTNSDPTVDSISVTPSTGPVGTELTCAATASDDDGGTPTITYVWSSGDTGDTYTIAASDDPGDVITCTATAADTDGGTASDTASATVTNTDPVIDSVTVSPSTAKVGEDLTCAATASDADGGTPTITYAWSSGGSGDTYTVDPSDNPGDTITCTATAIDTDGGSTSDSASATVENTDPEVDSVAISPTSATNDDTLVCAATASDSDGGTPTLTYAWSGSTSGSLGSGATVDLSATSAVSSETITCTATATDTDLGTGTATDTLTLDNRSPTISVSLSPSSGATKTDTLTCTATVADDDDDSLSTTFAWTVAGTSVSASSSSGLTSTLAGAFAAGEEVICTATTDDSKGGTASDSASTTITNTAPTVSAVTLDKSTLYTNDTLTASVTSSDPEGDSLTTTYDWYVDGTSVQDSTSDTLNGASASVGFDKGEDVYVVVSVTDGFDTTTSTSSTLTVSNTPPEAPVVTIDPSDAVAGEDLFCEVTTASTDADGDTVTYTMSWTADAATYTGASTDTWTDDTVDGADTVADEVWVCTATPNDGDDDGSTATDSVTVADSCNSGIVVLSSSSVDFVEICAGSFDMGCTAGQSSCDSDESPVMPVTLTRNYYLSQTEITQAQYQALMGSNPSTFTSCGTDCPVESVTWHMAAAFANAVSAAEGVTECYSCSGSGSSVSCSLAMDFYACDGYRLPTEAEWEGAARCGEDLLYAGSNTIEDVAWYLSNASSITHSVGQKAPNACGLYDMSGNVLEWNSDWYGSSFYTSGGRTDPTGSTVGPERVMRGGSWASYDYDTRTATRFALTPTASDRGWGFRLARTVDADYDGDGYTLSEDCDDDDASIHPRAGDTYGDGIDSDCDGLDCEGDSVGDAYLVSCVGAVTWSDARDTCTAAGHDSLATIASASEQSLMESLMNATSTHFTWIGLNDIAVDGTFEWDDGTAVSYTNWKSGEPSGTTSSGLPEDCTVVQSNLSYQWNDAQCALTTLDGFACSTR